MPTEYSLSLTRVRAPTALQRPPLSVGRVVRRLRAVFRLYMRKRRARRHVDDLRHLDERTLRDLGVTRSELQSVVAELGGRAAATRRHTDLAVWTSASSRFRVRAIDSSL